MRAFDRASSAERLHALGHGGEAEALRRRRIDSLAVVDDGEAKGGLRPLRPVTPVSALLHEVDGEVGGRAVPDGIGDTFLDAAIEREIDRLAIRFRQPAGRIIDLRIGMTALEAGDQLIDQIGQADAPVRPRPELFQKRPVHQLQPLDDAENFADAVSDAGGARIGQLIGDGLNGGCVRGDAKQAGSGFVMQLVGNVAPLLFLHRDELPVEAAILFAGDIERAGERVEAVGDDGKLLHLGRGETRCVMTVLQASPCRGTGFAAD